MFHIILKGGIRKEVIRFDVSYGLYEQYFKENIYQSYISLYSLILFDYNKGITIDFKEIKRRGFGE